MRVRSRDAVAGDVGVIAAEDPRNLFQVRLRAAVAGGVWTSIYLFVRKSHRFFSGVHQIIIKNT